MKKEIGASITPFPAQGVTLNLSEASVVRFLIESEKMGLGANYKHKLTPLQRETRQRISQKLLEIFDMPTNSFTSE